MDIMTPTAALPLASIACPLLGAAAIVFREQTEGGKWTLDVCQRRRGVVDPKCNLPGRAALGRIAASHGLFEGGRWCDSDYGHAEIGVTAAACADKIRIVRQ